MKTIKFMRRFFSLLIIVGIAFQSYGQTEQKPEPEQRPATLPEEQQREEQPRLPEFELPEFVITGRAVFRLPFVQKPKFDEEYVYIAEIPETLPPAERDIDTQPVDLPTKTFGEFIKLPAEYRGQLRIGYGRFVSPTVYGWANYRLGNWNLSGQVDYFSTNGYEPFAEEINFDSRFRVGYHIPETANLIGGGRMHLMIGFHKHKHEIIERFFQDEYDLIPRTFGSNIAEIGFFSGTKLPFDYELTFGWRGTTIRDNEEKIISDDEVYTTFRTLGYLGNIRLTTDIQFIVNYLDHISPVADPNYFKGAVRALIPFAENRFSVELGGGVYSSRPTHADFSTDIKPFVEVRYLISDPLTFYATYSPERVHQSYYKLRMRYPYLSGRIRMYHIDERINFRVGTKYMPTRKLHMNIYGVYQEMDFYPLVSSLEIDDGTWRIVFTGRTNVFGLHSDLHYMISDKDLLTAQVVLRQSDHDPTDMSVPYLPDYELAAMYTRELPYNIRTVLGVELLGSQEAFLILPDEIKPFLNVSLDVQYQFHNIIGVYLRLDNLLNQNYERYYLYRARPFYLEGGIQIFW